MELRSKQDFRVTDCLIPLATIDGDFKVLELTKAVFEFFELPDNYVINDFGDLFGEFPQNLDRALLRNEKFVETLPLISKKGKQRWIRTTIFPADEKGSVFRVSFDDITLHKDHYDLTIRAQKIAKIGSWRVDFLNDTVYWSNITKDIHEVPRDYEPNLEKGIDFYKKGIHRERIVDAVTECMENGTPFDVELKIVTQKGREKWVRAIGEAEFGNGKLIALKGVFQDTDEINRERLKNQVKDQRIRVAVQSANIGIWDWDIFKDCLIWDENMLKLFNLGQEAFEGLNGEWPLLLHDEDRGRIKYELKMALEGKKEFDTEFRIVKSNGARAYIHGRAQVIRDSRGNASRMIGACTDITRIKRKDERLRKLLGVTEKQNQKLVNFAYIVSHNLRSNSANISMLSGMLLSEAGAGRTMEFLEMIQNSSEKLEETLNELNEIVKIQSTHNNDLMAIRVRPIIDDVCEGINAIIKETGAKITINVGDDISVWGIKAYLTSVFSNLLTNSIKYRSPLRPLHIIIEASKLEGQTILLFRDNGLGIDLKKHAKNLFGMYKTFHNNKDAKGVGLFISKNQMEAMNGKIEVGSTVQKGSDFYLYFNNGK